MSYEGFEQHICERGHLFEIDDSTYLEEPVRCPTCAALPAWTNYVDETNCDEVGIILDEGFETLKLTDQETQVCDLGHTHVTAEATYRIPTDAEADALRHYRDGEKYIPLGGSNS